MTFNINEFTTPDQLNQLIERAITEDLGPDRLDITTQTFIPENLTATAHVIARQPGTLAGAALIPHIIAAYNPNIALQAHLEDGATLQPGSNIATLTGPLRGILSAERLVLNFITHLSGIATLTSQFVKLTAGTPAKICDTRKTLPGLRHLQKYAVACGGGTNHRIGLHDAVLIKDNHLAHLHLDNLTAAVNLAAEKARQTQPNLKFVQVEVDTLDQLKHVLAADIDMVLLDNMSHDQLKQAVQLRDQLALAVLLEASGNVNLQTAQAIAQTGVDRISIGALTHSVPSLDCGLDIREDAP